MDAVIGEVLTRLVFAIAVGVPIVAIYAAISASGFLFSRTTGPRVQFYALTVLAVIGFGGALVLSVEAPFSASFFPILAQYFPSLVVILLSLAPGFLIERRSSWDEEGRGFTNWFSAFFPLVGLVYLAAQVIDLSFWGSSV